VSEELKPVSAGIVLPQVPVEPQVVWTPVEEPSGKPEPLYHLIVHPSGEYPYAEPYWSEGTRDEALKRLAKSEARVMVMRGGQLGRLEGKESPLSCFDDSSEETSDSPFSGGYLGELETVQIDDRVLLDPPALPNRRKPTPEADEEEEEPTLARPKSKPSDDGW